MPPIDRRSMTAPRCDVTTKGCRLRATASAPVRRPVEHGGFSLLEMLIVLTILAVIAAWTWPSLRRQLSANELRQAGKQVRAELARARHKAVKTGTMQQFRFQPGRPVFEVSALPSPEERPEPPTDLALDEDSDQATGLLGRTSAADPEEADRHELPDGTYFASAPLETTEDPAAVVDTWAASATGAPADDANDGLTAAALPGDDVWSPPIVFYPNGRTSSARIRVANSHGNHVDVTLRGLTGVATVGELRRGKVRQ